ncbi:acyltransferase [Natronoflexus pectinivorans]|uniref:Carbonic anhydrase/acetyltransferase-like protein (Isoleucine patch superfamily) n=1 Tax=Natronoflexus pectinivorans TaxID=682526 RepID=A0A4R2GHU4_9BACT|nr:acyltransferase [Natronoflexus pectinivorans]TCO06849.1 carbonic anhydrase/acetyltransferase-like protein (isoleucine patch superfamily) [Natronoflexus pectinivorans]
MIHSNIITGKNVSVHPSVSLNNVKLGDDVKIGKRTTIFGHPSRILQIGDGTRIGNNTIINGFAASLSIGKRCSIGTFCHFIVDTGPTASPQMLKKYPITEAPIAVGDDCFIGHGTMIIAGVTIGDGVIIRPKSFVNRDIPSFSEVGGSPAKIIRSLDMLK